MKITKTSMLTGKVHTLDLNVTLDQIKRFEESGELIQHVFPHLTADEREFLISGSTKEEWDTYMKDPEE